MSEKQAAKYQFLRPKFGNCSSAIFAFIEKCNETDIE